MRNGRAPAATPTLTPSRIVRCAVYTRKSTEEGLPQEFNSLDAQREAAEAYIASQRHEGWILIPDSYDDGGFTGANMERPALQRLLADIAADRADCVVVYKVDRLSRSLLDFARIMETFDKRGVSFVSVTQQFNTTASLGRLTLNILLSFAQFEREMIAERTRDKMSAARRKGKWVGGIPVLGYDVDPRGGRLVINADEAKQVRAIFNLYLEPRSPQSAHHHSDPTRREPAEPPRLESGLEYSKARAVRESYLARLAKIDFEERTEKLVSRDEMQVAAFNRYRMFRDGMLNIPNRLAGVLAAETDPRQVHELLATEIRKALTEFSDANRANG